MAINSTSRRRLLRWLYAPLALSLMTLQILAVLCAFEQPAHAYVDPGSGLLALQILGTTFAGFIFMVRRRVYLVFKKMTGRSEPKDEAIAPK